MPWHRKTGRQVVRIALGLVALATVACSDATGVVAPAAVDRETNSADVVLAGSGTWTTLPNGPTAGEFGCAITIGRYIYIMGGNGANDNRTIDRYDAVNGTWDTKGMLASGVQTFVCDLQTVNGKYYYSSDHGQPMYRWAPASATFTPVAMSPQFHVFGETVATETHIYKMGGANTPSMERYDPATNTWDIMAPMPASPLWGGAVHLDGKIYWIGGVNGNDNMHIYDIATNSWHSRPNPVGLVFPAVQVVDGTIYASGSGTAYAYTPSTDTWTQLASPPTTTARQASAVYGKKIFLFQGRDPSFEYSSETFSFRPAFAGNHAPIVDFSVLGTRAETSTLTFVANESDPDGDELSYSWSFGNGETSTEEEPTYAYPNTGTYSVSLTVSDGALSTTRTRTVIIGPGVPAPIAVVGAAYDPDFPGINLEWTYGSGLEPDRAELQRLDWDSVTASYGAWHVPTILDVGFNGASDGDISQGRLYRYRVRSCRGTACSAWVLSSPIKTTLIAEPPESLFVVADGVGILRYSWPVSVGQVDYYEIQRRYRTATGAPWTSWTYVAGTTDLSLSDIELTSGHQFQYRVRACNYGGCSAFTISNIRKVQ